MEPVSGWSETEGGGQKVSEGAALAGDAAGGGRGREEDGDEGGIGSELEQGLATGAAGNGGGLIEIGDGDGSETDLRAETDDGGGNGALLRAAGEAEAGVFDVAAGNDLSGVSTREEKRGPDPEAGVRGVGVFRGGKSVCAKIFGIVEREQTVRGEGGDL